MPSWRPTTYALIGAAVALVIGGTLLVNRALRQHDIIIASPIPPGVFVDGRVPLQAGDVACIGPVAFKPAAGRIRLVAQTAASPVPPLRITARTRTTTKTTVVSDYPSGKVTEIVVPFSVRQSASGSVCVRNAGTEPVALAATSEPRYATFTTTKLNGKPAPQRMQATLQLLSPSPSTILNRIPDAVRQDAQLTGVLPRVLVWLLLFTVLIAIIAGPLYVMSSVLRSDDENSG